MDQLRIVMLISGKLRVIGMVHSPIGAGPRILVLIGRTDMFPTWRTSPSSLKDE